MSLGQRIQQLRKKKGYSQEKLAEYLNMSRQAVAKWEQNVCEPNLDCLTEMAQLFEVDLDYLITGQITSNVQADKSSKESTVIIQEKSASLNKREIVCLIILIISSLCFIGLFIYALLNPLYYNQSYSFIWWYIRFWVSSGTWFRILNLITIFGIVWSLVKFLKSKK